MPSLWGILYNGGSVLEIFPEKNFTEFGIKVS